MLNMAIESGYNTIIYAFYSVSASGEFAKVGPSVPLKRSELKRGLVHYLVSLFGGATGNAPQVSEPEVWAKRIS